MKTRILTLFLALVAIKGLACTTAVISGKYTKSGRPMIWKHRDSGFNENKLMKFTDGKYMYMGVINSEDVKGKEVWGGYNETGFAIMNSASYNLREDKDAKFTDQEGVVMKRALQICKNLADFEKFLDTIAKPSGIEANFGVIDAEGGAAYYETNDNSYVKFDANDPRHAPMGYIVRSNYSFTGRYNEGYGFIRFATAERQFYFSSEKTELTPQFILENLSRSFENSLTGQDVYKMNFDEDKDQFVNISDCINRYSSVSSIVVEGVNSKKDVNQMVMWTMLGLPAISVAYPVYMTKKNSLPEILTAPKDEDSPMCKKVLELKKRFFSRTRGGENYINAPVLYNNSKTGLVQKIKPFQKLVYKKASQFKDIESSKKLERFQEELDIMIMRFYKSL